MVTALWPADRTDVLIESYRPGVAERLGLGPEARLARNPKLVYGRMTGRGQNGPLAGAAGHDITDIGRTGAPCSVGRVGEPPQVPLNVSGDSGGFPHLAAGVLAALFPRSGQAPLAPGGAR